MSKNAINLHRRRLLLGAAGGTLLALTGCPFRKNVPKVLIIGGGFGGCTVARYLLQWSSVPIELRIVTEKPTHFICPGSNQWIAGHEKNPRSIDYHSLIQQGVIVNTGKVVEIDRSGRRVRVDNEETYDYDWLVLAPGIAFQEDPLWVKGTLRAWGNLHEAQAFRQQLQTLKEGDTVVITIPAAPYRCPSAPYERTCLIAHAIQSKGIQARIIVLDENADIVSKGALFHRAFETHYEEIVDYRPETEVIDIDPDTKTVSTPFDEIEATIINRISPQQAPVLLAESGLIPKGQLWCPVNWQTMQSKADDRIFVVGDAVQSVFNLPKSAHVANSQAKLCAVSLVRLITEQPIFPEPVLMNCCFSHTTEDLAIHIASMSRYDLKTHDMVPIEASFSLSAEESQLESLYAKEWLENILNDSFEGPSEHATGLLGSD